jgi:SAM-dependent methyltransferase
MKKMIRKVVPSTPDIIEKMLKKELAGCKNVLDLGCGENSPLRLLKGNPDFKNLHSVGVDIFSPYILKNINEKKIHSEYLNMNIFDIDFPEKSFDCAILFDVIEHFNRQDFLNFLPKLEKISKKILIITPNGYIDQHEYDSNPYQIHKSGWTVEDFAALGFTCYGLSGLKSLKKFQLWPRPLNTLVADISQMFISDKPKRAFHIMAIKNTTL